MSVKQYLEKKIRFIKEDDIEVKKDVEPSDDETPIENEPEIQDAEPEPDKPLLLKHCQMQMMLLIK